MDRSLLILLMALPRETNSGHPWGSHAPVVRRQSGAVAVGAQQEEGLLRRVRDWPATPFPFAPGSGLPFVTFDRPWLSVDQSANTIYAAGHNVVDHEGFVTAS